MSTMLTRTSLCVFGWTAAAVWSACAATVSYDGFSNGPLADLDGSNGGVGWTSPWSNVNSSMLTRVGGDGLTYQGLRTSRGAASTESGGSYDAASYQRSFGPVTGGQLFISFLLRSDIGAGTYGGISLLGPYSLIGMPLTFNTYGMRLGHYLFVDTGIPVIQGQTALLVLELEVVGAQTAYRMYVNPDLSRGKPTTPNAQYSLAGNVMPQALSLVNDGGFTTDEMRVATTWTEAVPPPSGSCFTVRAPVDVSSCMDGQAQFAVSAIGSSGPIAYQWYKGPTLLSDGPTGFGSSIAGSQTSSVTIRGLTPDDAGFYYAVVTDPCGSVVSQSATLTVSRCTVCIADFNQDGGVDGADVEAFFVAWEAADVSADVNQDGGVDGGDVATFFVAWQAGGC
ncbi:MAG: hypothetical protein JSR77_00855 [Planctomycetes bacterium]|nr:hypothetical protein [Planctomycetota bacterium]